ncbi:MAG: helix-turn-helix domain-containing protein [Lachnospiraceae bacterium]|nr:helix-turn-helix domain-containing protein [Lachnospiraceae bacterium]
MITQHLPIEAMLPRISLSRLFETEKEPGQISPERIAELYELSFYIKGNGVINMNGNEYSVNYGDIRFARPGTYMCSTSYYSCYTVYFDFGQSNILYQNQLLDGIPEYFHTDGEYRKTFEELIRLFHSEELIAPVKQNALLLSLLSQLFEGVYSRKKYCTAVETSIAYMEKYYSRDISLDYLGKISGYSSLHLLRLFKRDTGYTPHDFLTSLRMNAAKRMLIYTDKPLTEIASECGFRSDSHFKILFKKTTGFTPGNYRKNAKIL